MTKLPPELTTDPALWSNRMTRYRGSRRIWLLLTLDMLGVVALLYGLAYYRDGAIRDYYHLLALVTLFLMTLVYNGLSAYRYPGDSTGAVPLAKSWFTVTLILVIYAFVTKTSDLFSRHVLITWFSSAYLLQLGNRYLVNFINKKWQEYIGTEARAPALMIGAGQLGRYLAKKINNNPWFDLKIVGVVDASEGRPHHWDVDGVKNLGRDLDRLPEWVKLYGIRSIYVALPVGESQAVEKIHTAVMDRNVNIYWAPDIFSMTLINPSVREFAGVPLLTLSESPLVGHNAAAKNMMDKILAPIALLLLSPLFIITAIAIKLESPGPVFFKQKRHGWDGAEFEIWKFRSMVTHDDSKVVQATRDDPRITRVGRFIRRTSIDELPQLFNVLQGTMSLVGPRPHATAHNEYFSSRINAYFARHRVKPGITGLAQINGFRGETDTLDKMDARVRFDLYYINNWSIWLDLEIMLRTAFTLFNKNAY